VIDGTRMLQTGFTDPASFFRDLIAEPWTNRRIKFEYGYSYPDEALIQLKLPLHGGKVNYIKLIDPATPMGRKSGEPSPQSKLEIVIDSLAIRYQWATGRTRSHEDQLEIDPTDMFFSYVDDNIPLERNLYWGKEDPNLKTVKIIGGFIGGSTLVKGPQPK
jgi:hypothetical protein